MALADAMARDGILSRPRGEDGQRYWRVTRRGIAWFAQIGLDTGALRGSLGVAMLRCMVEYGWLERKAGTRAVSVTKEGERAL
ncbi:MAG: hypothetical protein CBARDCOR_2414 [uncultured Caballeronia sp.]|nr:MAG: hypothetical protein CBARDCOR_2414 [uncultured Caballeronia sp.]